MNMMSCSDDLLIYLMDYYTLPSCLTWICCCRRFLEIGRNYLKQAIKERFRIDFEYHAARLNHEPLDKDNSWLNFYKRLDKSVTGFRGFAFDAFTSNYEPYPMEVVFNQGSNKNVQGIVATAIGLEASTLGSLTKLRLVELNGFCRWRTLRDSLTRIEGSLVDLNSESRFLIDPSTGRLLARHIIFEEKELIRGVDIAIPNRYYGFCDGFVILGSFDPGSEEARGMFCCVMEESIQFPRVNLTFNTHTKYIGLVSTARNRQVHHCTIQITKLEGSNLIKGIFRVDVSRGMSTLELERHSSPKWLSATFEASIGSNTDHILTNMIFQAPVKHLLIPYAPVSVFQQGSAMICFFKQQQQSKIIPASFVLYSSKYQQPSSM